MQPLNLFFVVCDFFLVSFCNSFGLLKLFLKFCCEETFDLDILCHTCLGLDNFLLKRLIHSQLEIVRLLFWNLRNEIIDHFHRILCLFFVLFCLWLSIRLCLFQIVYGSQEFLSCFLLLRFLNFECFPKIGPIRRGFLLILFNIFHHLHLWEYFINAFLLH